MHEYAVTRNIVNIAVDEAAKAGASRIKTITLVIGDLSTIIDESVQMYFDIVSENTAAMGAKLVFKRVPAEFLCKQCGTAFKKPLKGFECPLCGSLGTPTEKGREFYIESIEVE